MDSGEESRGRARVVARAVAERPPFTCARPLNTLTCSRNGSSAFIVGLNSKFEPAVFGVHMNGRGLSRTPDDAIGV